MDYSVSVSARGKRGAPIHRFIDEAFCDYTGKIDSVFGFTDYCRLYGGRQFIGTELTAADIWWMYDNDIGYRIPLTNLLVGKGEYDESRLFLDKYHRAGNSVIVAKHDLAEWIRNDFPLYKIECSVIARVKSVSRLEASMALYDTVVPDPKWANQNLNGIPEQIRDRVRLFLNAGCMYNCPNRICYTSFSKMNMGRGVFECDQMKGVYRHTQMHNFDLQDFVSKGFSKFKVLRENPFSKTGF